MSASNGLDVQSLGNAIIEPCPSVTVTIRVRDQLHTVSLVMDEATKVGGCEVTLVAIAAKLPTRTNGRPIMHRYLVTGESCVGEYMAVSEAAVTSLFERRIKEKCVSVVEIPLDYRG